jgi:hypothetical protein
VAAAAVCDGSPDRLAVLVAGHGRSAMAQISFPRVETLGCSGSAGHPGHL